MKQLIRKNNTIFIFALLLVAPTLGCDDDLKKSVATTDGVWRSYGYGMVAEIRGNQLTRYEITDVYCILSGTESLDDVGVVTLVNDNTVAVRLAGSVSEFRFDRISRLPPKCTNSESLQSGDDLVNFDVLWQTFQEHYAFFHLYDVNWETARQTYRPQVGTRDLFDIVTDMLSPLADGHIFVETENEFFSPAESVLLSRLPHIAVEFEAQTEIATGIEYFFSVVEESFGNVVATYLDSTTIETGAEAQLEWGRLGNHPDIGYIASLGMAGLCGDCTEQQEVQAADAAMSSAMTQLVDVSTLVVDMRFNTGGFDAVAREIAEHFVDGKQIGFIKKAVTSAGFTENQIVQMEGKRDQRFAGKIVILTSPLTASAAECFMLMMKDQSNVHSILGERTFGIFSDMLTKSLPNGWFFSLSNEVYMDAKGRSFEGVGITPNETLQTFSKSDRDNHVDSIIDRAIELATE